jgi:hypothetical protein
VHEFLAGDVAQMAEVMNVKEVTIEKWQSEVVKWLQPIPATALQAARR